VVLGPVVGNNILVLKLHHTLNPLCNSNYLGLVVFKTLKAFRFGILVSKRFVITISTY